VIQFFVFQFWPFPQIDLAFLEESGDSQEGQGEEFASHLSPSLEDTTVRLRRGTLSRGQRSRKRKNLRKTLRRSSSLLSLAVPVNPDPESLPSAQREPSLPEMISSSSPTETLEVDPLSSGKERINWEKVLKTEGQELNTLLSLLDEKRRLGSEPGELRVTEEAALSRNPRGSLKSKGENPLDKSKVLRVFGFKPASSATGKLPRPKPFSGASSLRRKEK